MKQNLLLLLIGLFGLSNVYAQFHANPAKTVGQIKTTASDDLFCWKYCDDEIESSVGVGDTMALSATIFMPASKAGIYAGKKIKKIRIGLAADCTDVSVWIRNSLTGADIVSQTLAVDTVYAGWTEITLAAPFEILDNDFYIGYTATGSYQIAFSGTSTIDGCWLWYNGWDNYEDMGWGSLCIQALIDMEGETILAAEPESLENGTTESDADYIIQGLVKNYSTENITSMKIACRINDQEWEEQIVETSIEPMKTGQIRISKKAPSATGIYTITVKIPEINGQANLWADKTSNMELWVLSQTFPRKTVMEEGTGTWCGWCPRGAVGMAMMKEKYPETFIGIAVHNSTSSYPDPMTVSAYDSYMRSRFFSGYPQAVVNRKKALICDPHPSNGAEEAFLSEMEKKPLAGVQLRGGFTTAEKNAVILKTTTTFGMSFDQAKFRLAYVLIENGVTGSGLGWAQVNYYANGVNGPMGGYENRPSSITNMVYNDVARGIYSGTTGIANSIPATITEMEPIEHTYTFNLPASVKNKSKLEVAVLLINSDTEEIENADRVEITDMLSLPVLAANAVSATVRDGLLFVHSASLVQGIDIYTISGQKVLSQRNADNTVPVNTLSAGVYIVKVKTSEGETAIKIVK